MSRKPHLMNLLRIRDIFEPQIAEIRKQLFIDDHLIVLHGTSDIFKLILRQDPPFIIDDHRMGIVLKGEAYINFNLVDKHIKAGMLIYLGPGSIISPVSISPDFEIFGFAITTDFPLPFALGQLPQAFNGQVRDFQLPGNETDLHTAHHILDTLWHERLQSTSSSQSYRHTDVSLRLCFPPVHTTSSKLTKQRTNHFRPIYLSCQPICHP